MRKVRIPAKIITKHGKSYTKEYNCWCRIKRRCTNENDQHYNSYGGRGITVCPQWINSFQNFYDDMGPAPSHKHSIDRIDFNGNYEPGNCQWATIDVQQNNRRSNVFIEYNGQRNTFAQWAKIVGISKEAMRGRIKAGWSIEKAVTTTKKVGGR